jgi:Fe-S oxidoreductase
MLSTRTVRFGGDLGGIKIIHVNELLAGMLDKNILQISRPLSESVTFHDPCALARYCHDTESSRKILKSIASGTFKEMETNKKLANCCGQGGMLRVHRPDIADRVAGLRLEEARETGAEILATGCSRCVAMLSGVQADNPARYPRVVNIVDLLALAIEL